MNKKEELDFMLGYAKEVDAEDEVMIGQLVSLFTAYCLHHDIEIDTVECDELVDELFYVLPEKAREHYEADGEGVDGNGPDAMENLYHELARYMC